VCIYIYVCMKRYINACELLQVFVTQPSPQVARNRKDSYEGTAPKIRVSEHRTAS
jgi:hypothetical protein